MDDRNSSDENAGNADEQESWSADDDRTSDMKSLLCKIAWTPEMELPFDITAEGVMLPLIDGRFKLLSSIDHGGMGVVYLAEDTKLRRQVAIKLLRAAPGNDWKRCFALFEREASALASLPPHPNVIGIHDKGIWRGWPYLVLDLLTDGETLAQRMTRGPCAPFEAVGIALQIARALVMVHGRGVIHRDITPRNIWVYENGLVKIYDFGLAALSAHARVSPQGDAPRAGPSTYRGGTPGYRAPEQIRGERVTASVDIFAVGIILFQLIANNLPFPLTWDGDAPARRLSHDVPSEITGIVDQCLALRSEDRIKSAVQLVRMLELAQQILSVRPEHDDAKSRAPRLERSNWRQGAALCASAALFVAIMVIQSRVPRSSPPVAGCNRFESRAKYLTSQLNLERRSSEIIYFTRNLTNVFYDDAYMKYEIEPNVTQKWPREALSVLSAMRARHELLKEKIEASSVSQVVVLFMKDAMLQDACEHSWAAGRYYGFVRWAREHTHTIRVCFVDQHAYDEVAGPLNGLALIHSDIGDRFAMARQANAPRSSIEWQNADIICDVAAYTEIGLKSRQLANFCDRDATLRTLGEIEASVSALYQDVATP